jgi:DNA-binding transcriptional LysR family regulator
LSLSELAGEPFVMYSASEATGLHASTMAACEAAGFTPEVAQIATQIATVLALVASGLGVCLIPEVARGERAPSIVYCDLDDTAPAVETALALLWHADRIGPAAQRFIDMCRARQP